jgi:hypothetical protein
MTIPSQYGPWLQALGFHEISFGCGGLRFFSLEEIDQAQVGCSRSPQGVSFCDGEPGSWKPEWIAIGYETGLGDVIILDTSRPGFPVMTAMLGEGSWNPDDIAGSLADLAVALRAFKEVSAGREDLVALEQNPLSSEERDRATQLIRGAVGDDACIFWETLLEW